MTPLGIVRPVQWSLTAQKLGEAERQRVAEIRDAIERALASPNFEPAALQWLARRDQYSTAATYLETLAEGNRLAFRGLLAVLNDRAAAPLWPRRLALTLGLADDREARIDVKKLRRMRNVGARVALACLGEIQWERAGRRERAAFLLGELVRLRHEAA